MASVEDMLAALVAEENSEETDDDGDATSAPKESSVMKQLRAEIKRRDKAAKAAEERATKAEEELSKRVADDNARVLLGAGLSPRQSEAFLKMYDGAVTVDNVADFQKDVLGATPPPVDEREEFRPTGDAGAGAGGEKPATLDELRRVSKEDPAAALALLRSGKVQFRQ